MRRMYKPTYEAVYAIHAKYGRTPPKGRDDKYWEAFTEEMSAYSRAHNDKFTTALLVAVAEELEREYNAAVHHNWAGAE